MTETLPQVCQDVIRAYFRLDFGDHRFVSCPYFQNVPHRRRFGTSAEVGKGSPAEIIAETKTRAAARWPACAAASAGEIRSFMVKEGIGVDCSGFVARVLDPWMRQQAGKPIGKVLRPGGKPWWQKILFSVRPFHSLNVRALTHPDNGTAVELTSCMPGDLIKTRGGKHILLISQTMHNAQGALTSCTYVHSSEAFGNESGVREGSIEVLDPHAPLERQEWREVWHGRKPALEGWMEKREKNGIFRLGALE